MNITKPLADILEDELRFQIIGTKQKPGMARIMGFRCYHTLRSKGSEPGFPDWTLARERILFIELKREAGEVSAAQKEWLAALHAAGEAYVVRPRHFDAIAAVLRARGPIERWNAEQREARGVLLVELERHIDVGRRAA